jgi:hypothetical protein
LLEYLIDEEQLSKVTSAAVGSDVDRAAHGCRQAVGVEMRVDIVSAGYEDAIGATDTLGDDRA